MADLRQQLEHCFRGRVCVVGVGNAGLGDDAVGVRLAERVRDGDGGNRRWEIGDGRSACGLTVLVAGTAPERHMTHLVEGGYDHILFLDAVAFGGAPGSVVWLGSDEIAARFPQVSTHKIALGTLAQCLAANGKAQVWLLGVQPASCRPEAPLCSPVQRTLELLTELLADAQAKRPSPQAPC